MKTQHRSRRSFLTMVLFALVAFQAPLAHAQVQKHRGHIKAIDLEKKTMVLDKKKGEETLAWDENTRVRSPATKEISGLKPGMFVLCFMREDGKLIATIRHDPEQDQSQDKKE